MMFTQILDPLGNLSLTFLLALVPVVLLLVLLAVLRLRAWLATLIGAIVTFGLGAWRGACRSAMACARSSTARRPGSGRSTGSRSGASSCSTPSRSPVCSLLPTLNSVGAEVGKPVAPQTASVGVATSRYVRNEGAVIRHNMGWTFVLLAYLILVGLLFYFFLPEKMMVA